jgi:hypothetical protein
MPIENSVIHLGTTERRDLFYQTLKQHPARNSFPLHRIVNMHKSNRKARIKTYNFPVSDPPGQWSNLLTVLGTLTCSNIYSRGLLRVDCTCNILWIVYRLHLQYCRLYLQYTLDCICNVVVCTVPSVLRLYLQYCRLHVPAEP